MIIYLGGDGKTTQRTLRPLEIVGDRLKAYCLTKRAPRVFIIDNILGSARGTGKRGLYRVATINQIRTS
ncbi:WYL domain-containing protein [Brevibacillus choshinensis]|uniref:WYL domain-containing protein n=1 Tax=Brevibacillus choshinensis TaxID=54911 RepID=UPI002E220F27|nr:WYL domain-containing protein [Brevibacillus choshinensis]